MASQPHTTPSPSMIVFTDLDGTLLDHSTYSHGPADGALKRLRTLGIPCVLTTSKTRAEVTAIRDRLRNRDPFIVENGSAVFIERRAPFDCTGLQHEHDSGLYVQRLGRPRDDILQQLRTPAISRYRWRGFADMPVEEIAQRTGLSAADARAASWREYCEPLVWLDDPLKLPEFARQLTALNLTCVRGGRFLHVLDAGADKGSAVRWLCSRLNAARPPTVIALGDSDNDAGMLNAADVAILVRSPHHEFPVAQGRRHTVRTDACGPEGWAEAIHSLLDDLDQD